MQINVTNPVTKLDYPDPDVIRVGDTYYMVSTTMHFMPGCEMLRSFDLVHWEHMSYVYDRLDSTPGQKLENGENIYGQGMWAASLRFHKGLFYICFAANDTGKTYLFTAESAAGPWERHSMEGFYHDGSLLFDDDGRVYIAYGNKEVYITELKPDLSGPLEGGLHRLAVSDAGHPGLGYEGTHFYKINGKYYLFFIHSLRDRWMRAEACFMAESLEGECTGGDVLADDMGYCGQGVAQGGIVDVPDGRWYAMLFQDRGAVGRIPVLVPVCWEDDMPVFGEGGRAPGEFTVFSGDFSKDAACRGSGDLHAGHSYEPLVQSDDFRGETGLGRAEEARRYGCFGLKSPWQFSHEPDLSHVRLDRQQGTLWMTAGRTCRGLTQAKNILTQRMCWPSCAGEVTVDAGALKEGDYAGICALQGCFGLVGVTRRDGGLYVVMQEEAALTEPCKTYGTMQPAEFGEHADQGNGTGSAEREAVPVTGSIIRLKIEADFTDMKDEARFSYMDAEGWKMIGVPHKLYFRLDHFTGCRFGLFFYATRTPGGAAGFRDFVYSRG